MRMYGSMSARLGLSSSQQGHLRVVNILVYVVGTSISGKVSCTVAKRLLASGDLDARLSLQNMEHFKNAIYSRTPNPAPPRFTEFTYHVVPYVNNDFYSEDPNVYGNCILNR